MLTDKVAVVTGGSRGIGAAISRKFAENGCRVAVIATHESEKTKKLLEELNELSECRMYTCNIAKESETQSTIDEIMADFGKIDILVNNAGITRDNLLIGLKEADIDDVIDVNLKGTIYMTKTVIKPMMRAKRGAIVNIASIVGLYGNAGQVNYAASKAGVVGACKSVAKEYASRGIRCNVIAPGFIRTDMTEMLGEKVIDECRGRIALGRLGEPDDIADAALFLASDMSSYITGEVLTVAGGMSI